MTEADSQMGADVALFLSIVCSHEHTHYMNVLSLKKVPEIKR